MKMKRTILTGLTAGLIMLIVSVSCVFADVYFTTPEYDVKAGVHKDGSISIEEEISVNIPGQMHGIYRYIPLSKEMTYMDDSGKILKTATVPIKIKDISTGGDPCDIYKEDGNMVIRVGDENSTVSGDKTYNISYTVKMYNDGVTDYDNLYYNFIPTDWSTPIERAVVVVNMPKKFNRKKLAVYSGQQGTNSAAGEIVYKVKGKRITVVGEDMMQGDGITVGIKLPEGYFKNMPTLDGKKAAAAAVIAVLSLLLLVLWFIFGRDRKVIRTVEFEPPEGITPAEIGYIIDGKADKQDIVSMIFYFAQKGYLSIEEPEKDRFVLRKEKDLPADVKAFERTFFYGLFAQGNGNAVVMKDIDDSFYSTYKASVEQVEMHYKNDSEKRIFPQSSTTAAFAAILIEIAGFITAGFIAGIINSQFIAAVFLLLPAMLSVFANFIGSDVTDRKYSMTKGKRIFKNILSLVLLAGAVYTSYGIGNWLTDSIPVAAALVFMCLCSYFAVRFMSRRTKYGTEIMGRVLGFRDFIKTAEHEKLEALVEENPTYFFDILPYAYVMGLSKKWAEKFEKIPTKEPYWYRGYYGHDVFFDALLFYSIFHRCTGFAGNSIKVPSSHGSGGSFGGGGFGGFSGGGFGGGGGGGW